MSHRYPITPLGPPPTINDKHVLTLYESTFSDLGPGTQTRYRVPGVRYGPSGFRGSTPQNIGITSTNRTEN